MMGYKQRRHYAWLWIQSNILSSNVSKERKKGSTEPTCLSVLLVPGWALKDANKSSLIIKNKKGCKKSYFPWLLGISFSSG